MCSMWPDLSLSPPWPDIRWNDTALELSKMWILKYYWCLDLDFIIKCDTTCKINCCQLKTSSCLATSPITLPTVRPIDTFEECSASCNQVVTSHHVEVKNKRLVRNTTPLIMLQQEIGDLILTLNMADRIHEQILCLKLWLFVAVILYSTRNII